MKKYGVLKRVGGAIAELVALLAPRRRRKNYPGLEATPIYTDKWSIQNEVHP